MPIILGLLAISSLCCPQFICLFLGLTSNPRSSWLDVLHDSLYVVGQVLIVFRYFTLLVLFGFTNVGETLYYSVFLFGPLTVGVLLLLGVLFSAIAMGIDVLFLLAGRFVKRLFSLLCNYPRRNRLTFSTKARLPYFRRL